MSKKDKNDLSAMEKRIAERFCKFNKEGIPTDIYAARLSKYFVDEYYKEKIKIINNKVFLYKDGAFRLDEDGKELKTTIGYMIPLDLREIKRIDRVFDLICVDCAINVSFENMNDYPVELINFKNGMLNVKTMQLLTHDPKYKSTNQIPWEYKPNQNYAGCVADKFFRGLIPDEADREMFYRFAGLCFGRDTEPQKLLTFVGLPATGKSVALTFLSEIIGAENTSCISLQDLNKRFYPTQLYGRLLNCCADLPKTALEATDVLKKATGEDQIMGEYKNGAIFFFKSYAKLLFSTNQLPPMLDEKSDAFFRRLLCINVKEKPPYIEDLKEGLAASKDAFICQCMQSLHNYYIEGKPALDSPNSLEVVRQYHKDCDSVSAFLDDTEILSRNDEVISTKLFNEYRTYCTEQGIQELSKRSFFQNLRGKDVQEVKKKGYSYFRSRAGRCSSQLVYPLSTPKTTQMDENGFVDIPEDGELPYTS